MKTYMPWWSRGRASALGAGGLGFKSTLGELPFSKLGLYSRKIRNLVFIKTFIYFQQNLQKLHVILNNEFLSYIFEL